MPGIKQQLLGMLLMLLCGNNKRKQRRRKWWAHLVSVMPAKMSHGLLVLLSTRRNRSARLIVKPSSPSR